MVLDQSKLYTVNPPSSMIFQAVSRKELLALDMAPNQISPRKEDVRYNTGGIPAPNSYPSPTDFDPKRPFSNAFSFGISREQCEKRYVEGHFKADPAVPGPGAYDPLKPLGSDASKFTLQPQIESKI